MSVEISAADAQTEADRRRDHPDTYTMALMIGADIGAVTEFMSKFNQNLEQFEKDFQMHLETHVDDLGEHYKRLVGGGEVAHKTFMQRYSYRCCDLMRIQRELEKHGIPKETEEWKKQKKEKIQRLKEQKELEKKRQEQEEMEKKRQQEMEEKKRLQQKQQEQQQEQQQEEAERKKKLEKETISMPTSSSSSRPKAKRSNSFSNRSRQPRRNNSVSKLIEQKEEEEAKKRSSAGSAKITPPSKIRFRGSESDPEKRSAWNPAEAGQEPDKDAASPPVPCQRQITGTSTDPDQADHNNGNDGNSKTSGTSSNTSNTSGGKGFRPSVLKKSTLTPPASPSEKEKKRWEDKAKHSPKNDALPPPQRKTSKQPPPPFKRKESLIDDDSDNDDTKDTQQQQQHMQLSPASAGPGPSIQSKMSAWSKAAGTSTSIRSLSPPNIQTNRSSESHSATDKNDDNATTTTDEMSSQTTTTTSSSAPSSRQIPEREGSARDIIEKLESTTSTGSTDSTAVRKWKPALKPAIPKPPSKNGSKPPGSSAADGAPPSRPGSLSRQNSAVKFADTEPSKTNGDDDDNDDPTMTTLTPMKKSSKALMDSGERVSFGPSSSTPNEGSSSTTSTVPKVALRKVTPNSNKFSTPQTSPTQPSRPSWADSPLVQKVREQHEKEQREKAEREKEQPPGSQPGDDTEHQAPLKGDDDAKKEEETGSATVTTKNVFAALPFISPGGSFVAKTQPKQNGDTADDKKNNNSNDNKDDIGTAEKSLSPPRRRGRVAAESNGSKPAWVKTKGTQEETSSKDNDTSTEKGTSTEPSKPESGSRSRRSRPYRNSARRAAAPENSASKDGNDGNNGSGDGNSTTAETSSTSNGRHDVRDRLKQWGRKGGGGSGDRRSSRSGKPSSSSGTGPGLEEGQSEHSVSTRSGSNSRRGMNRSRSPVSGRRSTRNANSRQSDGGPSVKDRLNTWGAGGRGGKSQPEGMPDRHPPRPTRSNDSLNGDTKQQGESTTPNNKSNNNAKGSINNPQNKSSNVSVHDWKPDPLAAKCVVRADRRRNAEDTYTQVLDLATLDPWEDGSEFDEFMGAFDLESLQDDIQIVLARFKNSVGFHFKRLVLTNKVSQEVFWKCYFYRCDEKRILRDLRRRESLGTLGQSMMFNNSSTDFMNDPRSEMGSVGGADAETVVTVESVKTTGTYKKRMPSRGSVKPTSSGGLDSMKPRQSISDKILKADENNVMSKGSLINRLKQWNKPPAAADKKPPLVKHDPKPVKEISTDQPDRGLERQDSDLSLDIGDGLEPFGNGNEDASQATSIGEKSSISKGSLVKDRLKNWAKVATGGKEAPAPSEARVKRTPRRAQSVPTSETKARASVAPQPQKTETTSNGKSPVPPPIGSPPIGSPTLRYSNRSGDRTVDDQDDEEPRLVKPSEIKRQHSSAKMSVA